MPRIISVAFPIPLRQVFSYSVPAPWEDAARAGRRVRGPLGSRVLSGVIVEEDPVADPNIELRDILEVLDDEAAVTPELFRSTHTLAERFFAPWGELLRACWPAGLPAAEAIRYEITEAGATAAAMADSGQRALLERFLERGRMSAAEMTSARQERSVLRELESRGWIRAVGRRAEGTRKTDVTFSAVTADEKTIRGAAGRSKIALKAYQFLRGLGRAASAEEIRQAGFSRATLARLVNTGVVSQAEQDRRQESPDFHQIVAPAFELSTPQQEALRRVTAAMLERHFFAALLLGVTGSGKTEVYLRAINATLEMGKGAVWLVPEIALTPVFSRSLTRLFGGRATVLHSAMSSARRVLAWQAMQKGDVRVVIGPRSAVFAPIPQIGLFIVDEEHDASYKQEDSPRYDARDAAAIRARALSAVLLMGSATPSMETFAASAAGRIELLSLPERVENRPLPEVFVVDLRKEQARPEEKGTPLFSAPVMQRLSEVFSRGEQAILLVPRRGYAPFLLCRDCGDDFRCGQCSVSQTVHRRTKSLVCHYCGRRRPIPKSCGRCGGIVLEAIGAGTERAAERFAQIFPAVPFAILDSDTARRAGGAAAIISSMENGNVQALIGTQMVAKGHHFPSVTAMVILSADALLNFPDFRAGEKTFQLLAQAAGRAGRGGRPGTVHIQTFHPDHPAILAAVHHDTEGFARRELEFRKTFFYPPFSEMAQIIISSPDQHAAQEAASAVARPLLNRKELRVSGPCPAPLERLSGRWRVQILIRSRSRKAILRALEQAMGEGTPAGAAVSVDVDPRNLM